MAERAGAKRVALIVDDDPDGVRAASQALQAGGFSTRHVGSHAAALEDARARRPACAVVSSTLDDRSSLEVVRDLVALGADIRVVVTTGFGSIRSAVQAIRLGATDYLLKPLHTEELLCAVDPERSSSSAKRWDAQILTLERARWEYIQRVLSHCRGNVSETARLLGLHRQSLQRMLRRHPPRS